MAFVSSLPVVDRVGSVATSASLLVKAPVRSARPAVRRTLFEASTRRFIFASTGIRMNASREPTADEKLVDWNDDEVEDPSVKAEASTLEDFLTFHAGGDSEGGFMPDMFISGYNFERTTVGEELEKERSSRSKPEPISLADALAFHVGADSPVTPAASEDYDEEDGEFE